MTLTERSASTQDPEPSVRLQLDRTHNLIRWIARLGGGDTDRLVVARTTRTRLLSLPGRLVNRAGTPTLRLPQHWPWADTFNNSLETLRNLKPVPI